MALLLTSWVITSGMICNRLASPRREATGCVPGLNRLPSLSLWYRLGPLENFLGGWVLWLSFWYGLNHILLLCMRGGQLSLLGQLVGCLKRSCWHWNIFWCKWKEVHTSWVPRGLFIQRQRPSGLTPSVKMVVWSLVVGKWMTIQCSLDGSLLKWVRVRLLFFSGMGSHNGRRLPLSS